MSTWTDLKKWDEYCSAEGCPVCSQRPDDRPEGEADIAELSVSGLVADRHTCIRVHCCLVSRPHAVELYELTEEDALAFMQDVGSAASPR